MLEFVHQYFGINQNLVFFIAVVLLFVVIRNVRKIVVGVFLLHLLGTVVHAVTEYVKTL